MIYLIEEQAQLDRLQTIFDSLHSHGGLLAVDTEFLREKTYNAKLCLVQLGIGDDQYCIDVLAIENLQVIADLFTDTSITKILHAARQDMEVLWQTVGVIPKPVFDSQLAAAFCGMDLQLGHTSLVLDRLGIELSKSQARTDWTRRPLSPQQLKYAAEDVAHLADLHQLLAEELDRAGKFEWFEQELEDLYQTEKYEMDPALAYQRLSGGALSLPQQYTLKALAQWRESMAQTRDIPRTWVIRDDRLYELASTMPTSVDQITKMNVFGRKSAARFAPMVADTIAKVEIGNQPVWHRVEPLDKQQRSVVGTMMKTLREIADSQGVAQGLLGTRRDLELLFRHQQSDKLLSGWRAPLVGEPLLAVVNNN